MLFITLAFVIRIIEALGNAAFLTASFAIIAKEFPDKVSLTFASLETFFGLGLIGTAFVVSLWNSVTSQKHTKNWTFFYLETTIVGPLVGGALYSVGGYFLPFVTLGLFLFLTAIITLCVLPKHNTSLQQDSSSGKYSILRNTCRSFKISENTLQIDSPYWFYNEHVFSILP